MNGYQDFAILKAHGVKAFVGGCYQRGVGSRFRAKAHSHCEEKIICFLSDKHLNRVELFIHELAHVLTNHGHDDIWRRKVVELGGTFQAVPGLLRSYEKKERTEVKL